MHVYLLFTRTLFSKIDVVILSGLNCLKRVTIFLLLLLTLTIVVVLSRCPGKSKEQQLEHGELIYSEQSSSLCKGTDAIKI